MNSGAVHPAADYPRGAGTFNRIADYPGAERRRTGPSEPIVEVTVLYAIPDILDHVDEVRERVNPRTVTAHRRPRATVKESWLIRVCAGLPAALTGLDDESASLLRARIDGAHAAVALRGDEPSKRRWTATLLGLADRTDVHGLVTGRLVRLLLDAGELDSTAAGVRLSRVLSVGTAATAKAAWVEGFLSGGGTLLVHDADLLALLDTWVATLPADAFTDVLPLLRRTFATFAGPERRTVGTQLRRSPSAGTSGGAGPAGGFEVDPELAASALPTVRLLLGVPA